MKRRCSINMLPLGLLTSPWYYPDNALFLGKRDTIGSIPCPSTSNYLVKSGDFFSEMILTIFINLASLFKSEKFVNFQLSSNVKLCIYFTFYSAFSKQDSRRVEMNLACGSKGESRVVCIDGDFFREHNRSPGHYLRRTN